MLLNESVVACVRSGVGRLLDLLEKVSYVEPKGSLIDNKGRGCNDAMMR